MSQIIPFEKANVPARFAAMFAVEKLGGVSGGFPIISIKGKVFTKVAGDDREIIKKPGEDDPASSIDVVILKQNVALSKVYYEGNYSEGSDEKPTCYSNNGHSPEQDAVAPQAKKCAVCPHNQWGSRITENGGKGKSCSDSRRIAVAPLGMINDPMLIRIPAASLKAIDQYGDSLVKRQVPYQLVVTKIGFDYTVAHPALTFKAQGMVDEATADQIVSVLEESVIDKILGIMPTIAAAPALAAPETQVTPAKEAAPAKVELTGPTPEELAATAAAEAKAAKIKAAKAAAAKAAAELAAMEAEEDAPAVALEVVAEPVAEPVAAKVAKPKAPALEVAGDLVSEIEGALNNLDFDDED